MPCISLVLQKCFWGRLHNVEFLVEHSGKILQIFYLKHIIQKNYLVPILSNFWGKHSDQSGPDYNTFSQKSVVAERRETMAVAAFDLLRQQVEQAGTLAKRELPQPDCHLTAPCYSTLSRLVVVCAGPSGMDDSPSHGLRRWEKGLEWDTPGQVFCRRWDLHPWAPS